MNSINNVINNVINKLTNITTINSISISKALIIFYLIIANNYTGNLFAGQLTDFIAENRMVQHIIAFTTLLVLLNLFCNINDVKESLAYTCGIYLWFIFTTKLSLTWNLGIIMFLLIGYLNESQMKDKEYNIDNDSNVPEEINNKIKNKNNIVRCYVTVGILIITLCGTYEYYNKKSVQYGGDFDPVKYMFKECNNHKCYKLV